MERNDIGGGLVVPRLVVVFEGLIAAIPDKKVLARAKALARMHRWKRVINCFEANEEVLKHLWHLTWQKDLEFDVVTYLGEQYEAPIERWLDREDVPYRHIWSDEPRLLARRLATMPHVAAVYDAEPSRQFMYGGKGRIVNPAKPDLIGWFGGR